MMRCMSSAIAGLKAHQTAMDVIGNNISNVDTMAFKAGSTSFRDTMYQEVSAGAGGNTSSGTAGTNPSQIGYGAAASGVSLNTTAGSQNQTGRTGDVYINGEGYLVVADGPLTATTTKLDSTSTLTNAATMYTASDNNSVKYTRVGQLNFDHQGFLTDGNGHYVLGQQYLKTGANAGSYSVGYNASGDTTVYDFAKAGSPTDKLSAIRYDPAAGEISKVSIASDGTITGTRGGSVITIGKIGLANFPNASGLKQAGDGYYKISTNSGDAAYSDPSGNSTGPLISGALENSNTDLATEFSNMVMYERGYQANTKILSVSDEMYQTLVNMK